MGEDDEPLMLWCTHSVKRARSVAHTVKKNLPAATRSSEGGGHVEAQRAVFDYHAEVVTQGLERGADARCSVLLVQAREGESDNIGPGWKLLWEGRRPRDRERFRLYQRQP